MLNAISFYRVSRWLYLHHIPVLPKLITLLIFLIYNSKIPYQVKIGRGSTFGYGGMGIIIHSKSIIGGNRTICPVIGNNVYIAKGSIVMGGITIGNNVTNRSKRSRNQTSSR